MLAGSDCGRQGGQGAGRAGEPQPWGQPGWGSGAGAAGTKGGPGPETASRAAPPGQGRGTPRAGRHGLRRAGWAGWAGWAGKASRSRHTSHNARASSSAKGTTRCADSGALRDNCRSRGTCWRVKRRGHGFRDATAHSHLHLTSAHATDQRGDAGEKLRPTRRPATLRRSDASSRCGGGPRGASGPSRGPRGPARPSRRAARESHFLDAFFSGSSGHTPCTCMWI